MGKKIVILGTGGTIAGTAKSSGDHTGYTAAQIGVDQLVQAIPSLAGLGLVTEQVAQLDSKDMGFEVWQRLAQRAAHWLADGNVQGIVITHGTDTVEETAYFLQAVLQPAKPIVLTCAMRPATALAPDGPQNVVDSVTVAQTPGARGVTLVCAGVVHDARAVQKVHTYRLDAFVSGDDGPVGYVEQGAVRCVRDWPAVESPKAALLDQPASSWPRVDVLLNYAGADGRLVRLLRQDGVQGIVVAGTGNGTLHHDLEAALHDAVEAGIHVVRATRCAFGRVFGSAGRELPDSQGLSPVKARVALMLALGEAARPAAR
jgi:L-asparaginase